MHYCVMQVQSGQGGVLGDVMPGQWRASRFIARSPTRRASLGAGCVPAARGERVHLEPDHDSHFDRPVMFGASEVVEVR